MSPNPQSPGPGRETETKTKTIKTTHCRFCNHLLLATTRTLSSLPRRNPPAQDQALILPLPPLPSTNDETENETEGENGHKGGNGHYSILLATTVKDRKATLVRREDGFEKRVFLRCGRCRVVVGYFLASSGSGSNAGGVGEGREVEDQVVYLLPGGLVETDEMVSGDEAVLKRLDEEWSSWTA
ncbi:hypothetical protein BDV25DRAFT_161460 [Aspergillus avenaceus]|uniref:STEEP1 domain-containing protein n=1 Tax=Aspergillus avenaceus TaxID=36643 RepID=A0A5N6TKU2_ASPAV|nr:hypothetical protein BDV25DRAFT_161460 [Aspergillus avenaceus]